MRTGLEPSMHAEGVEALRDRLARGEAPPDPGGWPSAVRLVLEPMLAGEAAEGDPALADAVARLVLMAEVWDCLDSDGPGEAALLPGFFAEALDRLAAGLARGEPVGAASWILVESEARWGEYLALIDPSIGPRDEPGEPASSAVVEDPTDEVPAFDAAELLRRLSGAAGPGPVPSAMREGPSGPPEVVAAATLDRPADPPTPAPPDHPGPDPIAEARALELDAELRGVFLADAADLFGRIQGLVLGLGGGDDPGRLHELGRCYHTLKGAAGSVGLLALAGEIHALEDELEAAGGAASGALVRRLEGSLSLLEGVLGALDAAGAPGGVASEQTGASAGDGPGARAPSVDDGAAAGPEAGDPDGLIRMPASRFDELMDLCSELLTKRRAWADQAERMARLAGAARHCGYRLRGSVDLLDEALPAGSIGGLAGRGPGGDELSGLVRRMSEQAEDLSALAATSREAAIPMATDAEDLSRLSLRLWDGLQSVRIVPVRGLLQRLVRVARDAARVEGRTIEVELIGEETGADRLLLDKAYEPLLHVVRNAVGHGIEAPEDRERAGKPPAGRITLEARREGNAIALEVRDDGRGLDYEAIAAKGRRLGLIGADERPGPDRLNGLIFQAGFSTRGRANAVSGRGVGMDVVAREVERLRGRIELTSRAGAGTRLTIRLPSRISLEHVMVVRIGGQAFAVPTSAIVAVHRGSMVEQADPAAGPVVLAGDRELPLIDLGPILGFSGANRESCPTLLVATSESGPVALRVDRIDGPIELVLKPLGPLLAGHPAISGAGLSTGGEVIPALDVAGLLRLARAGEAASVADPGPSPAVERPVALVVDDSLSVRRVASRKLRALGFEVDEASDGEEALGRLRSRSYRLVMTDLEMPRMDGFALLAELGRTDVLEATGVVVASTLTDRETRRRVLELGALAFVPKPVDAEELAAAVGPLLARGGRPATSPGRRVEPPRTRPN